MADGETLPILNPRSVSRYEELYEVWRCYGADIRRQKTTNDGVPFELLAQAVSEARYCTVP